MKDTANPPSESVRAKFMNLVCRLSPENLTCDGEASAEEADAAEKGIRSEWAALETQIGRKVTENEVWSW
jgi:hypothetical protein